MDIRTDWQESDLLTVKDINRIAGNLATLSGSTAGALGKTWTADSYLTAEDWNTITGTADRLAAMWGVAIIGVSTVDGSIIAEQVRYIEKVCEEVNRKQIIMMNNKKYQRHAGTGYTGAGYYLR